MAVAALIFWWNWVPLTSVRSQTNPADRKNWRNLPLRWLHLQLGMLLLLMPLQVGLFHGVSLSALVANMWAVPIISIITVPAVLMALLTSLMPAVASWLWYIADLSINMIFFPLDTLQKGWLAVGKNSILASYSGWLWL